VLTTDEVARRLGVKPATIYAYVSRGLLPSRRNADGKGSLFAESDVEAFAATRRPTASESPPIRTGITLIRDGNLYYRGHDAAWLATQASYESVATLLWTGQDPSAFPSRPPDAVVDKGGLAVSDSRGGYDGMSDADEVSGAAGGRPTIAARADPGGFRDSGAGGRRDSGAGGFRDSGAGGGRDSSAGGGRGGATKPFGGPVEAGGGRSGRVESIRFRVSPELLALAEAVTAPLPPAARLTDRLRVIVAAAAAADPLRFDTAPAAVIATGRTMLATMVAALPLRRLTEPPFDERFPLAGVLWPRLTANDPTTEGIATLNAALVLLADHDMAASTLAARVAASTRAHPYAVVGAGLAALDGPLHGAASGLTYALLAEAVRTADPVGAISDILRTGDAIPGFGHRLYPGGDPRATTLLAMLDENQVAAGKARRPAGTSRGARKTIDNLAAAVTQRSGRQPNIDFAIAAFALLNNMDAEAGEAIFAIARTAGWIAHALEEYTDRPSRFRPSGHYAGRPPTA